jgi:para-nitrobenzyl esterase
VPPAEAFRTGSATAVPLLIGTNRDEAKMFMVADPKNRHPDEDVVLRRIHRAFEANGVGLSPERVIDAYRSHRRDRGQPSDARELWSAIESDRMFRIGSLQAAEGHVKHQRATYSYLFTWESPAMRGALGACHALEIPFVFGNLAAPGMAGFAGSGPAAEELSRQMMDSWLAFARSGRPAHQGIPEWRPYDTEHRSTMVFGPETHMESAPMDEERQVWEGSISR